MTESHHQRLLFTRMFYAAFILSDIINNRLFVQYEPYRKCLFATYNRIGIALSILGLGHTEALLSYTNFVSTSIPRRFFEGK